MSDTFKARCDQARVDGARARLGAHSRPEDIAAAFKQHNLMEPATERVSPVAAEVVRMDAGELHRWFLASFAPRLHEKVTRGCAEKGWVFTCPKQKVWKAAPRPKPGSPKRIAAEQPLFGTYGFLRPENPENIDWMGLDRIEGLGGLVRRPITKEPVFLPMGEVEKFTRLEAEGFFDQTRSRPPKVKRLDQVEITSGLFQGKRGFVSMTAGERVKVLLGMLGQVELPVDQVELVA